jgi:hypothetical protein
MPGVRLLHAGSGICVCPVFTHSSACSVLLGRFAALCLRQSSRHRQSETPEGRSARRR